MADNRIVRLSRIVLRLFARIVPSAERDAWLQEWDAEVGHQHERLAASPLRRQQELHMFRRVLGSFHDAAWLRRQFTRDAEIVHDLRYGARLLRRNPVFSALTIAVLALGIGATVGIFSIVDALMIRELPYPDADRIVLLFEAETANPAAVDDVAPGTFLDWRERSQSVEAIAAAEPSSFTYTGGAEPESLPGARVTAGFFEAFGVQPLHGRTFTPEEYQAGRNRVVVLSYGTWARRFGGDPAIVGQTVRLSGQPFVVVGVMPRTFATRMQSAAAERGIWSPKIINEWEYDIRGSRFFSVVARLKPGTTREQAQTELDGISHRIAREHPRTNAGWGAQVVSLRDHLAGRLRPAVGLLLGAVALLLLVAAANTANLLIARNANRSQEIAVRAAIGAARARLLRQFVVETLLLAGLGCTAGLVLAHATIRLIVSLAPADIPALATVGLDGRVLLFAAGLTTVVALVVGVVPAWQGTRGRPANVLRGSARGYAAASTRHRLRATLVGAELAVALLLLTGAGLLLRSFASLLETNPGFTAERVAALQIFARGSTRTPAQRAVYFQEIIERMQRLPQVQAAGAVSAMPFIESNISMETEVVIDGRVIPSAGDAPSAFITIATPGYFPTMGIPLRGGRKLDEHDRMGRAPVALVSETFARRHWPDTSPIGQRVRYRLEGDQLAAEIVGVVGDVRHGGLDRPTRAEMFVPHAQAPFAEMTFVARTTDEPAQSFGALKAQIYAVDPTQAVSRTATVPELIAKSMTDRRFMLVLLLVFALLAVTLAAAGVYGVIAVVTAQRTREFGLRLALGAGRLEILGMVLRQGAGMAGAGLAIGLAAALTFGRVMNRFVYGITPADPATLAGVVIVLACVALLACALPARRATRVDPMVALRSE